MQKKLAVISDLSGYGRCSLTVTLPVVSALKVQCCPVPTAILSAHTAFPGCFRDDYTSKMEEYMQHWKDLNLSFDGILTGYLSSVKQAELVLDFIRFFQKTHTLLIIDPVMGDHGNVYTSFSREMCDTVAQLARKAHVLTPNLTEACILTNTSYRESGWEAEELEDICRTLGNPSIVITGIHRGDEIGNFIYENQSGTLLYEKRAGADRPGTGDIFAAIVAADAVNGVPFEKSVRKASGFIKKCIQKSIELDIPLTDGVCFEEVLSQLRI